MVIFNRLQKNLKRLRPRIKELQTDCFRLYDRDIPDYPYSIDIYKDNVVISHFYSDIDNEPEKVNHLNETQKAITDLLKIPTEKQFIKIRTPQKGKQQYERHNKKGEAIIVHENDAQFYVNLTDYLDTGLFLDHRPIRYLIRKYVQDKTFLNLFCYTASVTVHAIKAGARESVSMDLSSTYLDWAAKNFQLNGFDPDHHHLITADCLKWAFDDSPIRQKFDVIFIDPPSFSNSKKMEDILDVQRDHVALIQRGMKCLTEGGHLFFSCNLRSFVLDQNLREEYNVTDISAKSIPVDFRDQKIHQAYIFQRKK